MGLVELEVQGGRDSTRRKPYGGTDAKGTHGYLPAR